MKKFVAHLFKCIIAGAISLVLLSLFSLVYYNPPIATEQPDFVTNYRFVPNKNWSFMLEGVGFGKTDNLGYNNAYYNECLDPDIVFIGSSHLEALQVPQDANCVYILNKMFDEDKEEYNNFKCINLGVSGHSFEVLASNFKYVADKFSDAKYILIETSNVEFSSEVLDDVIAGKFHTPIEKKGFIAETAQKIPFIRLMYKKFNESATAKGATVAPATDSRSQKAEPDMNIYIEKMNIILGGISEISTEKGVKPMVLLHESFWEDKDGNIVTNMNNTYKDAFMKCCADNGIKVIDASLDFVSAYKENFEFSYGFSNGAPGEGHLNKTGHRIMAETIYRKINEMEETK
ncbi:MAG: hypothetical protein IKW06_04385 [Clostridia bacterium]|nr:hypothetical protein [Clostridia bacterium]